MITVTCNKQKSTNTTHCIANDQSCIIDNFIPLHQVVQSANTLPHSHSRSDMFAPRPVAHATLKAFSIGHHCTNSSRLFSLLSVPANSYMHNIAASPTNQQILSRYFATKIQFKKPPPSKADAVIRNNRITFPEMRVVYDDVTTGKSAWKIMKRGQALAFAKSKSLDLVLGEP